LAYPATTGMIANTETEIPSAVLAPEINPMLTYAGDDVIITGAIGDIFDARTFSGPNRAEKMARQLPGPDAMEFAKSFAAARAKLAALLESPKAPPLTQKQRIAIASIDPQLMSSALDAIDEVDTSRADDQPAPVAVPEQ